MDNVDIEYLNRHNFKVLMDVLSMPGTIGKIEPLFNSYMLAIANVLLYSQVSFYYDGNEEFDLIEAITNASNVSSKDADYIFCDELNLDALQNAKIGTSKDPEFSGTLIYKCEDFKGLKIKLQGPGIDREKNVEFPIDSKFIEVFKEKNSLYPLGNELFFLNKNGEVMALARTTLVEVV